METDSRIFCMLGIVFLFISVSNCSVYQKYYDEAYRIASAMTVEQKIGQTVQLDFYAITTQNGTDPSEVAKLNLGSVLVAGNGAPDDNGNLIIMQNMDQNKLIQCYANATLDRWQKFTDKFKNLSMQITTAEGKIYDIGLLIATDAVHNDQHVSGNILFPHNIGLSCSHNPAHFYNLGKWTAQNVQKSGFNYVFAPTVAVSHNPQWGRYYETLGQQDEWIYQYSRSFVEGVQGKPGSFSGILASAKHFIGDGATMYGTDQGNAHVGSYKSFISHNVQGYNGSVTAEVGSVMCSVSAINWLALSLSPLLGTLLRNKLKFDGFIISDYNQMPRLKQQQLPTNFNTFNDLNYSTCQMINSGIDMAMLSTKKLVFNYFDGIQFSLKNNTLTMDRLNDAVARILSVKLALGIAKIRTNENVSQQEIVYPSSSILSANSQYEDSLQAVRQSLVLLKNSNAIPLKLPKLQYIVLVGQRIININNLGKYQLFLNYDDIGMQSGGWSLRWQGFEGNGLWVGRNKKLSNASSIFDALSNLNQKFNIVKPNYTTFTQTSVIDEERTKYLNQLITIRKNMNANNTVIIVVVGESPYAEFQGDVGIPYCLNETLGGEGCLYGGNAYLPRKQRQSLVYQFDKFEADVISQIREQDKNIPLVTVLLAGRPLLIDNILNESSAVLHAFLPGTSGGQGIIDALTGAYILRPNGQSDLRNSLSFDWPKNSLQLARFPFYSANGKVPIIDDPLFKVGYGLSTLTS